MLAAPKKTGEQVRVDVPVQMWPHGGGDQVGAGIVTVTVDLDDANATTNSLLLHLEPDAGIAAVFGDYRGCLNTLRRRKSSASTAPTRWKGWCATSCSANWRSARSTG